jgi:hypothetical protein
MVQINVPTSSQRALEATVPQPVLGQTSYFYAITRLATQWVNGGTLLVLTLVKDVTEYPPTSFKGNVAVWGPYNDALSPSTYRLTVTDNGQHRYSYVLEGKAKQEPDTAFRILLSGSHAAATDSKGHPLKGFGHGTFLIDWNQINALPFGDGSVGTGAFTYSRTQSNAQVEIDVTFTQVMDQLTHQRFDANYRYTAAPNADGKFEFSTYRKNDSGPAERLAIESRWKTTGAGRSDVIVSSSGTVSPAPTISECWDQFFTSEFLRVSYDHSQNYGSESACAFSPAEYPVL